jgi:putative ABC transport system substrate-binding protein
MKRRKFLGLVGGATAWPVMAKAQQRVTPVIGFLHSQSPDQTTANRVLEFRQGLKETGYVEGENVTIEYRWAKGEFDRLPTLASDLVRRQVAVIVATGGTESASAAKRATSTIPIVFTTGGDPVRLGLVASLNRPGGNATGVTPFTRQLGPKRLGLLRAIVPTATLVAVLGHQDELDFDAQLKDIQEAGRTIGLQILPIRVSSDRDFETAFTTLVRARAGGLLIVGGSFFNAHRIELSILAAHHRVPAISTTRDFPKAGGLMGYGSSIPDAYHQVGVYAGRIVKGEKPADLPVIQPTKFELVINLKTAKTLGLDVPLHLQQIADEVIE